MIPACEVCWYYGREVPATWGTLIRGTCGYWGWHMVCDEHATSLDRLPWKAAEQAFR